MLTAMLDPSESDDSAVWVGELKMLPERGSMLPVASSLRLHEMLKVSIARCWRHSGNITRTSANSLGDKGAPAILAAKGQKKQARESEQVKMLQIVEFQEFPAMQ